MVLKIPRSKTDQFKQVKEMLLASTGGARAAQFRKACVSRIPCSAGPKRV